jgi:hypothetical protein
MGSCGRLFVRVVVLGHLIALAVGLGSSQPLSAASNAAAADPEVIAWVAGANGVHRVAARGVEVSVEALDSPPWEARSIAFCPERTTTLEVSRGEPSQRWGVFERQPGVDTTSTTTLPVPADEELVDVWCTDRDARDFVVSVRLADADASDPERRSVVRVSRSGSAELWNGNAEALEFHERALYVATGSELIVVDLTTGAEQEVATVSGVRALSVTDDGQEIAALAQAGVSRATSLSVLDAARPELRRELRPRALRGTPRDVAWLDDRHVLVSTDQQLTIVDTTTGEVSELLTLPGDIARSVLIADAAAILEVAGLTPFSRADAQAASDEAVGGRPSGAAWIVGIAAFGLMIGLALYGRRWARARLDSLHSR